MQGTRCVYLFYIYPCSALAVRDPRMKRKCIPLKNRLRASLPAAQGRRRRIYQILPISSTTACNIERRAVFETNGACLRYFSNGYCTRNEGKNASCYRSSKTKQKTATLNEKKKTHLSRRVRREHHPDPDEIILGQHIVDLGSDQPVQAESQHFAVFVARGRYACKKTGDASDQNSSIE